MIPAWVQNGAETALDDLRAILNPLQQVDLGDVLRLTPLGRRVEVMIAWAGITQERWCTEAGLEEATVSRWLRGVHSMPFGAAIRLARVIGVDPVLLFEGQLKKSEGPRPTYAGLRRAGRAAWTRRTE